MELNPDLKSIESQIDCLARLTGAPGSFVEQVRQLFVRKGISLQEDATPYIPALEQAFKREETIRTSAKKTQKNLDEVQQHFKQIGQSYRKQIDQLKKIRESLQRTARNLPDKGVATASAPAPKGKKRVLIATKRPTVVTRPQRDRSYPMVPGPKEMQ